MELFWKHYNIIVGLMCVLVGDYCIVTVKCQVFTSSQTLLELAKYQHVVLKNLDDYIAEQENILAKIKNDKVAELNTDTTPSEQTLADIKRKASNLKKLALSKRSGKDFIQHPINALYLIKHWVQLLDVIEAFNSSLITRINPFDLSGFPSTMDYQGAISAMVRLQKTYNLPTEEIAKGIVHNMSADVNMDKSDWLEMARKAQEEDHGQALSWFKLILQSGVNDLDNVQGIYQNMTKLYIQCNDSASALKVVKQRLKEDPDDEHLLELFKDISKESKYQQTRGDPKPVPNCWRSAQEIQLDRYKELCRGENITNHISVDPHLMCIYRQGVLPYIRYKEEIHSFNPRISLILEAITDQKAKMLKTRSMFQLGQAQVGSSKTETTGQRTAKTAWVDDDNDPDIQQLSHRVADITGMETSNSVTTSRWKWDGAEPFQVSNYGLGGQYEPHYDYTLNKTLQHEMVMASGDRLATFMYYLSDVTAGGATVFTKLGVSIRPVKNAAVYWYNFRLNGDRDTLTEHAGCPVLLGYKWVANKWIRQNGQMFQRRCALDKDDTDPIWYN